MDDITAPTLVVDEDKCRRNIRHMATKAREAATDFRPHFKTHQSQTIGRWFRDAGVEKIAVSSFAMADYFAQDQWQDIMVAFPVNIREHQAMNQLAQCINLSILLADAQVLPVINSTLKHPLGFYVKLDVGNRRSGFDPGDITSIQHLLTETNANPLLQFRGFVAHAGHTYHTDSLNDVHRVFREASEQLSQTTAFFKDKYPDIIASWGDTPSCSLVNEFPGIDEIRPGNFVFYDLMQYHLASCDWDHIAVAMAAPVVARQTERKEVVIYGGAVHLSKDAITLADGRQVYGEVVRFSQNSWERFPEPLYLTRLSQEHGIISCPDTHLGDFLPGSLVGIIPVHSCLTADLLPDFYNLKTGEFL